MGSQRLGACAPRKDAERRPRPSLPAGDQQQPAVNAEHRLLPACAGMLGLTACRDGYIRVHDAPALRAVSDRRVVAPVIHVLTRIGLVELCSHSVGPFVAPAEARRVEAKRLAKVLEGPYAIRARPMHDGQLTVWLTCANIELPTDRSIVIVVLSNDDRNKEEPLDFLRRRSSG